MQALLFSLFRLRSATAPKSRLANIARLSASLLSYSAEQAELKAHMEMATTNGNQQEKHALTVKLFRILKKQCKARQSKQHKKNDDSMKKGAECIAEKMTATEK